MAASTYRVTARTMGREYHVDVRTTKPGVEGIALATQRGMQMIYTAAVEGIAAVRQAPALEHLTTEPRTGPRRDDNLDTVVAHQTEEERQEQRVEYVTDQLGSWITTAEQLRLKAVAELTAATRPGQVGQFLSWDTVGLLEADARAVVATATLEYVEAAQADDEDTATVLRNVRKQLTRELTGASFTNRSSGQVHNISDDAQRQAKADFIRLIDDYRI